MFQQLAIPMQVRQQDGLGLNIKDFMLHVGSFNPGLLAQWSIMPGNQELANPQVGMLPVQWSCVLRVQGISKASTCLQDRS